MIVRKHIRVYGLVQGVYFRAHTREQAISLGLVGFVMNEPTGTVYMEVEGTADAVDRLVAWAKTGPTRARVDKLEISDGLVRGDQTFDIRR